MEQTKLNINRKITVVKSLILPNLTYTASCMIITHEIKQKFKNLIHNFIWSGKQDRIKRSILCKPYLDGGFKKNDWFRLLYKILAN